MPGPTFSVELGAPIGRWTFAHAAPDDTLSAHVVEYWEVQGELAPFRERILPNGCAELMFNLGPSHRMIADGETLAHCFFLCASSVFVPVIRRALRWPVE